MPLTFDRQEDIPETLRADFVQVGEKWVPNGYVPAETHEEMKRKANPERLAELEEATKGLDLKAARTALAEVEQLRRAAAAKAAGVEPDKLDQLREEWVGKIRTDHETALEAERTARKAVEDKLGAATARLDELEIEGGLERAAAKVGLRPEALRDAAARARGVFRREEDGRIVPRRADGKLYYIDGKEATFETWLLDQRSDSGHWFKAPASGSGATGNGSSAGSGKTWTKSQYDAASPAERMAFFKEGGQVE